MSEDKETPQPEISSDEEWKRQMQAENAALDEKVAGEKKDETTNSTEQIEQDSEKTKVPPKLPPADFSMLIGMFSTQAMVALGAIPNPVSGKSEVELETARHFIDLISVVEEKTKGNLTNEEQGLLDSTLHHLRLMYLEQSKSDAKSTASTE
ncbi:MAG: DUF1844 domain-containing protein [Planctomycetaceae bacterium]